VKTSAGMDAAGIHLKCSPRGGLHRQLSARIIDGPYVLRLPEPIEVDVRSGDAAGPIDREFNAAVFFILERVLPRSTMTVLNQNPGA